MQEKKINPYITNREIIKLPLHEILINNGYSIKKDKTSRNYIALTNKNGDSVLITQKSNGDYLYFNPNDEKDRGNIFNFAKNRGVAYEVLLNAEKKEISYSFNPSTQKDESAKEEVLKEYFEADTLNLKENVFTLKRLIESSILERFADDTLGLKNKNHNILSPTYTIKDSKYSTFIPIISGYIKYLNAPIQKDSKSIKQLCYGNKGLEMLKEKDTKLNMLTRVILTESMIDSLSLFEMHHKNNEKNFLLCSTNGVPTQSQFRVMEFLNKNLPKEAQIILGFDNDEKGREFSKKCLEFFKGREVRQSIPSFKDFNDDLFIAKALNIPLNSTLLEIKTELNAIANTIKRIRQTDNYLESAKDENYKRAEFLSHSLLFLERKISYKIPYTNYKQEAIKFLNHYQEMNKCNSKD